MITIFHVKTQCICYMYIKYIKIHFFLNEMRNSKPLYVVYYIIFIKNKLFVRDSIVKSKKQKRKRER